MLEQLRVLAPFFALAIFGAAAVWALVRLNDGREEGRLATFLARWSFQPTSLGSSPRAVLAIASVLGLFLEMLLIRWVSSEVRIFAYYKNFVLIACFLGFGLGGYLSKRPVNLLTMLVPLVLLVLFVEVPREMVEKLPALLASSSEVHIWGMPVMPPDAESLLQLAAGVAVSLPVFALIAFVFVPVGQVVSALLEGDPSGVRAYTINIVGSLAGILAFTLVSFAAQPPVVWLAIAALLVVTLVLRSPRLLATTLVAFGISLAIVACGPSSAPGVHWSPYQKLRIEPVVDERGDVTLYRLTTNGFWYQQIIDLSPAFVAKHPREFERVPIEWNPYNIPYRFHRKPRSVLVLGAGMGNDVAAALRNGAEHVVAVEIDPLIIQLGKERHFEHPYSDEKRVRIVVDDARSYLENAHETFDLVCFSLLDSHTTSSHFSNIRIDNYVYTQEALVAAKRALKPDGVIVVKFMVGAPWIAGRLHGLLEDAFGRPQPIQFQTDFNDVVRYASPGRMFVAGNSLDALKETVLGDEGLRRYLANHAGVQSEPAKLTTDDWPYFYQHEPGLPLLVIVLSVALVVLTAWLVRRVRGVTQAPFSWPLFFLGAGFMLLETQIVSRIALLFGTTWLVNSIAISGLLALIVGANGVAALWPRLPLGAAHVALAAAIVLNWLVPTHSLFFESPATRALAATAFLGLPVFFAGIVFIRTFADAGYKGEALGSNLMGALAGGVLESLSFWTGLRALLVIALGLYLGAFLTHHFRKATPAATRC